MVSAALSNDSTPEDAPSLNDGVGPSPIDSLILTVPDWFMDLADCGYMRFSFSDLAMSDR